MRIPAALACIILTGPALAQDRWPDLFDVTGVADSDVLNIRSEPAASSEKIGELAPDQFGVEVIGTSEDGTWGQINLDEGTGWVSLAFLERQASNEDEPPRPVACFGTEPFWSLDLSTEVPLLNEMGVGEQIFIVTGEAWAAGRRDRHALSFEGDDGQVMMTVQQTACSDGMSDRAYGLQADLLMSSPDGTKYLSGCCTLSNF